MAGTLPVLELPTDFPRPAMQTFNGSTRYSVLSKAAVDRLEELSRGEGATIFMTLMAAFQILLHRYTEQIDICVGTPIANREREELEVLIGFFVNTLVLRINLSGDPSFREALSRVREAALGAYDNQDLPFEKLVEVLQQERDPSRSPLFQVWFALQNAPMGALKLSGLTLSFVDLVPTTAKFDLSVSATFLAEGLHHAWEFNTDLFRETTIERMMQHFEVLLESIADNPDQPLSRLPLLSGLEQRTLLHDWNDTATELPATQTIHGLFELQAARTPENLAASSAGEHLNYRELNERANRLAHFLRRVGVRRGALVGVCLARSVEMLVAVLGVLKAGAAYVPLDPGYPAERLRLMVEDSGMRVLVAQGEEEWAQAVGSLERVVDVVREREQIGKEDSREPEVEVTGEDAAYVIYTSGSTGKPKGVVGLHAGAVNRFNWMWKAYPFEDSEICCQKTSLSFLDSLWEMFGPVLQGVPTVIIPDEVVKDPVRLVATLAESQVTRIVLVPSLLRVLLEAFTNLGSRLPRLKYWVSSGEALPLDLQRRFHEVIPAGRLLNLYGSSEVSADVTYHETSALGPAAEGGLIGRPIANTQIYILNRDMKPVPLGVPGDLYVGGLNLARGYLHKSDLTAEKFVPDPYSGEVGARLYHTGDIACYLPDGNIEYLGRIDHQVKVRGFRVELGDVEAALREHGAIRQALVEAREDEPGNRRLVAYYVCSNGQAPQDGELRGFLQLKLQEFMIPSAFIQLEELPLTPNGKVNRLALPVPGKSYPNKNKPFNAPRTHVEKSISEIWQEVLGLDQVSVDDNFFHLGGQSLLIIRVQSLLKERLNVDRPVAELFKYPTISALAASIAGETAQRSHVQSQERGKRRKARRRFASKVS
jgi:amino acid adenylation domain-containing protein